MRKVLLTTVDNPYDPDSQYEKWRKFDDDKNYHTSELLARVAAVPENLGETEYWQAIESAIDEIIRFEHIYHDVLIYRKIVKEVSDEPLETD